jgi:hypothetical protein
MEDQLWWWWWQLWLLLVGCYTSKADDSSQWLSLVSSQWLSVSVAQLLVSSDLTVIASTHKHA